MILGIIGDEVVELTGHQELVENKINTLLDRTQTKGLYGVVTFGNMGTESLVQRICAKRGIRYVAFHSLLPVETILDFIEYLAVIRRPTPHKRLDKIQQLCKLPMLTITLDGKEKWQNL